MKPAKRIRPRHLPLLEMFLNEYEAMRQKMDAEAMPALLEIAPLIFGKWYHSALVAETILSPANIISKDLEKSGSCSEFAYVLRTHPRKQGAGQYTFSLYEYSLEAHPLVEDMKTLVGFCYPDCRTDEQGFLLPQAREILLPRLSIPEGFYLEYLTRLAWLAFCFPCPPFTHIKCSLLRHAGNFLHRVQRKSYGSWQKRHARLQPSVSCAPCIWRTA